jgi:transcription-repair coupling factor (superfamily II helicase)
MNRRINEILDLISRDSELVDLCAQAQRQARHLNVAGLCEQEKGYFTVALSKVIKKKPVIIVADPVRAREMASLLNVFVDDEVVVVQPSEMALVSAYASSRDSEIDRVGSLSKILSNDFGAAIICGGALLNKLPSRKAFLKNVLSIKLGENFDPASMAEKLTFMGYERVGTVENRGEFSWRGDVLDLFSPDMNKPLRISFFDDEIDQLKYFDTQSQRSEEVLKKAKIYPSREIVIDSDKRSELATAMYSAAVEDSNNMKASSQKAIADMLLKTASSDSEAIRNGLRCSGIARWTDILIDSPSSVLDYIDLKECMVFADEFQEIRSREDSYLAEYMSRFKAGFEMGTAPKCASEALFGIQDAMRMLDSKQTVVTLACLSSSGNGLPGGYTYMCQGLAGESYRGGFERVASLVKRASPNDVVALMVTGSSRTAAFLTGLKEQSVQVEVIEAPLSSGFIYPRIGLTLIGELDVFGNEKIVKKKKTGPNKISAFSDLVAGDYVVHDVHGIGRYEGLVNMKVGDSFQDYLKVSYAKEAAVYLTVDNLDSIQKYVGPNGNEPKLSSLDSQEWNKSVAKARNSIKEIAFDLVKLYASRRSNKGFSCGPDDVWQKEFEESFPYTETDDQIAAINDIKRDMEGQMPMDRLLCGDVGFGKTEVAFRAMFKCVDNGRQAFMLAPTTLLAQQHYDNFVERCKNFPIKIALLSRYVPANVMRQTIKDIRNGLIDVVIGTHRLLSKDIVPSKLGLLVVDEEQRFGVNHKEHIKALRTNIDVLTLTATPIPRTLHMSMSGIRDISVLDEAPMNRRSVQTYVIAYDEEIVIQACMREISRHGQVFYLYNRTKDIDKKASELSKLMPGARIAYAHGQMSETKIEDTIQGFIKGKFDILVCTTIIESGVDMPNVNTMIVENSERFGLSQLYQIRGRVGRSDKQAYAYMTYHPDKEMKSDAKKRLMAIREFTELGSGIKIALRDLEVRGAGNLLGAEQHGQMNVIGYELYCRMLDEEIKRLRDSGDTEFTPPVISTVEIDIDSYIPSKYIEDEESRMNAYRRISAIGSKADYDEFINDIVDRYGEPPKQVTVLASVSLVRSLAGKAHFEKVAVREVGVFLYFAKDRKVDMKAVSAIVASDGFAGKIMINAQGKAYMHYKPSVQTREKTLQDTVRLLKIMLDEASSEVS